MKSVYSLPYFAPPGGYPEHYKKPWHDKSDEQLARRAANLVTLNSVFNNHAITMIPFYGTLLGMVRDNGLVRGDRDDDCIIMHTDMEKFSESVLMEIKTKGFEVVRIYGEGEGHRHCITLGRNLRTIDLTLYTPHGENCYKYHDNTNVIHRSYLDNLQELEVLGDVFKIPSKEKKVLAALYGDDWGIPKARKWSQRYSLLEY